MTDQAPAPFAGPMRILSGIQASGSLHLARIGNVRVAYTDADVARLEVARQVQRELGRFIGNSTIEWNPVGWLKVQEQGPRSRCRGRVR